MGRGRGFFFKLCLVWRVEDVPFNYLPTVQLLAYFGFYQGTNVGVCSPTLLHYMTKLEMRGRGRKK
jgi:hypothetical protein